MTELRFPICPICKKEILLPFSIMQVLDTSHEKKYGTWACSNCGFFLSTKDNRAVNPEHDIKAGFSESLRKNVEELRREYHESLK